MDIQYVKDELQKRYDYLESKGIVYFNDDKVLGGYKLKSRKFREFLKENAEQVEYYKSWSPLVKYGDRQLRKYKPKQDLPKEKKKDFKKIVKYYLDSKDLRRLLVLKIPPEMRQKMLDRATKRSDLR